MVLGRAILHSLLRLMLSDCKERLLGYPLVKETIAREIVESHWLTCAQQSACSHPSFFDAGAESLPSDPWVSSAECWWWMSGCGQSWSLAHSRACADWQRLLCPGFQALLSEISQSWWLEQYQHPFDLWELTSPAPGAASCSPRSFLVSWSETLWFSPSRL